VKNIQKQQECVSHFGLAHLHQKSILRQKKTYYGNAKYFTMQKYNLPQKKKNTLKETKILQDVNTL
jgi:hypothetical protein